MYPSDLDVRTLRADAVVAPAMVAIYGTDEEGYPAFDHGVSTAAGGSVNTLIRFTGVTMIDFKMVASTALSSNEFYNRMERATTRMINQCVQESLCSKQAVRFPGSVSKKLPSWDERLPATYVVFFRVVGAYQTAKAVQDRLWRAMGLGGVLGGIVVSLKPEDWAIASATVVDISNGEVIWFRIAPIARSRDIMEVRRAVAELASNLF